MGKKKRVKGETGTRGATDDDWLKAHPGPRTRGKSGDVDTKSVLSIFALVRYGTKEVKPTVTIGSAPLDSCACAHE